MARWMFVAIFIVFASCMNSRADADIVEHTFHVGNLQVDRLCKTTVITAVNSQLPGPTIYVHDGDTLVVNVINESPYSITIHWHGVFQLLSNWHDGVNMVTQCPIEPGSSYVYRFNVTGQQGTLWWHAHASALRGTVYGAIVILPKREGGAYPFPVPYQEIPILLGEWYNANLMDVDNEAFLAGTLVSKSDSYTINGQPGDLYPCSENNTFKLRVSHGKTYMLRMVNAAINSPMFFRVAGHSLTVVAADGEYTVPYITDVLVLAPGQSLDVLMTAIAPPGRYYMASHVYISNIPGPNPFSIIDSTNATAIVEYESAARSLPLRSPVMPTLPSYFDTPAAFHFYSNLTSLLRPGCPTVPLRVDERMFITVGMGSVPCEAHQTKCNGSSPIRAIAASMNNVSFQYPKKMSLLEAHHFGVEGVYTTDFPSNPPVAFDYTSKDNILNYALFGTTKGTKLKKLKYNATVEIVFQDTALNGLEGHPVHLHGFNFFVVAQGFGNYDAATASKNYNLVNPLTRNTIAVPVGGWAVVRFVANNPGVWFMHCHFDTHLPIGMATAFEVEGGGTPESTLPPPPPDYPKC